MARATPPPSDTTPPPSPNWAPIDPLDIVDELRDSYLTYAQSVMVSRALPDVRDGLKPSQRRILVAMNDLGLTPNAATSKCAGIIGETMKRYHPHGDASIYDTLVRMAQDWVMRSKLIHGQGNFGSIAGLPPAAHRYTEARLTPAAAEMLADLDHETVDFIDNYDGKYREPLVLPSKFPNLLVNGSDGIAVGMATDIPPHNLREVCDGLIKLIDDPEATLQELLEIIPGPDFPTGGIVMGRHGIVRGYLGERSRITLRARADIVEDSKGKTPHIVIKEVPFQVTRNRLAELIGELVKEERIRDISGIRDESSARNGEPVRLVVELKRGADPHLVLNQLYQLSPLQKTVSISLLALVDGRPLVLTLKEMMQKFLDHRVQVIRRRTQYLLREAKRRGHVLEGQLIAISSLDEVIRICRTSPSRSEAKDRLQGMAVAASVLRTAIGEAGFDALQQELGLTEAYRMTEAQAEAVVRMQLGQLAALESDEILKEYKQLREQIRGYEELLGDEGQVKAVIRKDLTDIRDKYGNDRKTEITDDGGDVDMEDLIADEPAVVTISHEGFIKRLPMDTYRVQNRGGKGVSGGLRENDFIEHFFVATTKSYLLCFTDRGQMYWLKVYRIPEASRTSAGRSIANVLQLKPDEKISSVIPVRQFDEGYHLLMTTKKGTIKKSALTDYSRVRAGGIIGINLDEGDSLIGVCLTKPGDELILSTRNGMAIRFSEADAREMGRNTRGVRGINMASDDEIIGMVVADPEGYLLAVCEKGYGKRTPFGPNSAGEVADEGDDEATAPDIAAEVAEPADAGEVGGEEGEEATSRSAMRYRLQRRGGKGLRDIKTSDRNGKVIGTASVRDGDEIMLITMQGMVTRSRVDDIRIVGRNTQGVRVMNLNDGDRIATLAKVAREAVAEPAAALPPAAE
ncbi:DNA gyrase subunit A [Fimbriiglobus ruber]|uniref:DNA gyrase subunit A n=1 Tax=Fimbriiglobus ruber TaxID=1908690 RepID=UPI001EE73EDE|nr:DNA gyrase subunit A [Fimbriiglobus ruber]